jgi:hypothetical protein
VLQLVEDLRLLQVFFVPGSVLARMPRFEIGESESSDVVPYGQPIFNRYFTVQPAGTLELMAHET